MTSSSLSYSIPISLFRNHIHDCLTPTLPDIRKQRECPTLCQNMNESDHAKVSFLACKDTKTCILMLYFWTEDLLATFWYWGEQIVTISVSTKKHINIYIYIISVRKKNNASSGVWIDFVWFPNIGVFRRENFQLSPGPFDFIHFCWVAGTKFQGDPGEGLSEKSHGSLGIGIQDEFTMYPSLKLTTWAGPGPWKMDGLENFSNRLEYDFVSFWGKFGLSSGAFAVSFGEVYHLDFLESMPGRWIPMIFLSRKSFRKNDRSMGGRYCSVCWQFTAGQIRLFSLDGYDSRGCTIEMIEIIY